MQNLSLSFKDLKSSIGSNIRGYFFFYNKLWGSFVQADIGRCHVYLTTWCKHFQSFEKLTFSMKSEKKSFLVILLTTGCNKNMITENPALAGQQHGVGVASLRQGSCLLPAGQAPWLLLSP